MLKKLIIVLLGTIVCMTANASSTIIGTGETEKPMRFYYNKESIYCMALNIYFEARNDHTAGQAAVGDVVLNRVMHKDYPNSICAVIKQGPTSKWWKEKGKEVPLRDRCQFSWYCDGRSDEPKKGDSWQKAYDIALGLVVLNRYRGITEGATHYHATYVNPSWSKNLFLVGRIGEHIFYRK